MARLEDKIIRGLEDIGYSGPLIKFSQLQAAAEIGQKDVEYTKLVAFLTHEIRTLLNIDEEVNAISSPEDSVAFVMEITSFLKELNCPYKTLTTGLVSERLQNHSDRLLLIDYLLTELMGARILQEKKPEKKIELKLQETPEGADMRQILQTLRFPKPPANITIKQLFDKLDTTIPLVMKKANADLVGRGLFNGVLTEKQWEVLVGVQNDLNNEYKIRREMLLTRLDVTIQSFQWSDRTRGKDDLFERIYHEKRKLLKADPDVDISDLIAARTDVAVIEKTSNASVRKNTKTPINKVIIGQVPDRGGRSWEQAPPPPEMPSWQQRSGPGGGGGGFGGGRGGSAQGSRGGGGGGYNRGGGGNRNEGRSGDYQQSGGYQARGSGGYQDYNSGGGGGGGGGYSNRGDYDKRYSGGGASGGNSYENRGYSGGNSYSSRSSDSYSSRGGGNDSYGYNRRDSGYGGQDFQQNKRPKTYDSFQANKTTYADQYVQEREHNQQYQRGGRDNYQRGRSSYQRGGGSYR